MERAERRDEPGGATAGAARIGTGIAEADSFLPQPPRSQAGTRGLGAGQLRVWKLDRGCLDQAPVRPLLYQAPLISPGFVDPVQNGGHGAVVQWHVREERDKGGWDYG